MEYVAAFLEGLTLVFQWPAIGYLILGVFLGIWLGAVPGVGGFTGLILLLPFTYKMEAVPAFALLLGMFAITSTSDTIASVLLGIPGTAASQATILDGHPLARKGQASRAFGAAYTVSAIGGIIGGLLMAASLPIIRPFLLKFGEPEFFMLTLWAYVRYVARPCWSRYGLVFGFLALGLMAKPMLVTVPFVLLLLDYWPLGRIRLDETLGVKATRLVLEKVPLFVLVVASSVVTFVAQQRAGATHLTDVVPFGMRVANALVSYVAYLCKTVWPSGLAVFYPYRDLLPAAHWLGAAVALGGISVSAVWVGRRSRYLPVG